MATHLHVQKEMITSTYLMRKGRPATYLLWKDPSTYLPTYLSIWKSVCYESKNLFQYHKLAYIFIRFLCILNQFPSIFNEFLHIFKQFPFIFNQFRPAVQPARLPLGLGYLSRRIYRRRWLPLPISLERHSNSYPSIQKGLSPIYFFVL